MRFSQLHGVRRTVEDDWFDVLLPVDTNLYVDPFLIYEDGDPRWRGAHDHILNFFGMIFGLVRDSGGDKQSLSWQQAKRLLLFPEPPEFCLGLSEGSPMGSGSSYGLQEGMLEGVRTAIGLGMDNLTHMETLSLFQGGFGLDRISDAVCNILKSYFIEYTQEICLRHGIPMEKFRVRNAAWSETFARWCEREVDLPANPFVGRRQPVLLVPRRFLKDFPIVSPDGFWSYAWANHAQELRGDFNFDIARNVPRRVKAKMARQRPEIVTRYLEHLEQQEHEPYPLDEDPAMKTLWYESGAAIAERSPLSYVPESVSDFQDFVKSILESFRHYVEQQDGWKLLWDGARGQPERVAQALFRACVIHYCRANDIALHGESNAGRGPVDFTFSRGWSARALVEMKLMRSSKFWDGILAQTPQYARSEEVKAAYFVAIAYKEAELESSRVEKVKRAARLASERNNIEIVPLIIDATRKDSASKLGADESIMEDLDDDSEETDDGSEET